MESRTDWIIRKEFYADNDNYYSDRIFLDWDIHKWTHTGRVGESVYVINTPMASRAISVYIVQRYGRRI